MTLRANADIAQAVLSRDVPLLTLTRGSPEGMVRGLTQLERSGESAAEPGFSF